MVQLKRKIGKWLLIILCCEINDENVLWCTTQQNRMLSPSSCICKSFLRQVFNRPRKLNIDNMLLALLFICPCINRRSSGTLTMTQRFGLSKWRDISLSITYQIYFNVWCFYNWSVLLYSYSYGYLIVLLQFVLHVRVLC